MRVGIIAIQHESNTFVSQETTLNDFRRDALLVGSEMTDYCKGTQHETGGFYGQLQSEHIEFVPLLLALATPGGPLTAETASHLIELAVGQLHRAGNLDGLLVAPHGAAVAENILDFDGHWLHRIRNEVGNEMPIVGTLDPHANVSQQMVEATTALVAYRTNPHVDQHRTGRNAAVLLARTLRSEVNPTQSFAQPPMAISIDRQETAAEPCRDLYQRADDMLLEAGVLSTSIALGFPYADVAEMGTSFIVVTDNDRQQAGAAASTLAEHGWARRQAFSCGLPNIEAAIQEVLLKQDRVCLLDVGDNVGGGAAGDGTSLLRELCEKKFTSSLVCIWDPKAASTARTLGVGKQAELSIGGIEATEQGPPLSATVSVQWLGDGRFTETAAVHGGRNAYDMGPTAVVQLVDGPTVVLMSNRVPPFSLGQLTACRLDPAAFRVIVAKGVHAPVAAYRAVSDRFIRVNTPGITAANMKQFEFHHRRRPMFPFEEILPPK